MAPSLARSESDFAYFHKLCSNLGLELAPEKSIKSTKSIEWLGFMIDTQTKTITIPNKKLNETLILCQNWMTARTATLKQIQSLAGKLNHLAQAIPIARKFLSRITSSAKSKT